MTCGIYHVKNLVNNKLYIGQSLHIEKRWSRHRSLAKSCDRHLYQSIRKYGIDNFEFSILAILPRDLDILDLIETVYIKTKNTIHPNGYNMTTGGKNAIPTEESKQKMSNSHKGKILSEEHKKSISIASKIQMNRPEIVDKITIKTRKPLIVDGVYYKSRKEYVDFTGKNHGTIYYQLKKRGLI